MQNNVNSMIDVSNGSYRTNNGDVVWNEKLETSHSNNLQEVPNATLNPVVYTVKPGDTLWSISQTYLGTGKKYCEIQSLNHLKDETIHPGQTILIPQNLMSGWLLYNVKSGDTLWNLSRSYLGSWTKYNIIMGINNLQNETIYPGQILKIPIKNQNNIYTVQSGDNLWSIALKLLGDGNRFY